ncbi:MAG: hypothetical protein ACM30G_20360 [Micromonosporaceae bacterium]
MTTPTPRWTAETAELVRATCFDAMACAPWPPPTEDDVINLVEAGELPETYDREAAEHYAELYVAEQVLATLADAGVLTAVGGETYDEGGCPGGTCRSHGFGKHTHRRVLIVWPDGSRHYGPWREVTDGG